MHREIPLHTSCTVRLEANATWLYLANRLNRKGDTLPEVFSTIDAGQDLAPPAHIHVFINLGFFQGFTTAVAGEEDHL